MLQWSCMDVRAGLWRKLRAKEFMLLNCGVGEDSWESLGLQGDPSSPFWRRSALGFLWKEWCWSWNSSTLATSCKELTHWKRLWCWEDWGQEEKGTTEDEMAGWHHWLHGRESGWTPGVRDGQGGLVCCNSWGCKESDTTERLNWTDGFENIIQVNQVGLFSLSVGSVSLTPRITDGQSLHSCYLVSCTFRHRYELLLPHGPSQPVH